MRIKTDICIIGSGIAGALAAYKLADKTKNIVILEAGPRTSREDIINGFKTSHQQDFSAGYPNAKHAPRPDWSKDVPYIKNIGPEALHFEYLKLVGGTTWHWNANVNRLLESDFNLKTQYGVGDDWPINFDDLKKYYAEAENEIGVSGNHHNDDFAPRAEKFPMPAIPMSYAETQIKNQLQTIGYECVERSVARNSENRDGRSQCIGYGTCSPICPSAAQYAAIHHIKKAERKDVRIIDNARVTKLEDNKNGEIKSAHFKKPDGSTHTVNAKVFIIAAGGVETPKILLVSRSKYSPYGIANSSGLVGKNFFDHPGLSCQLLMPEPIFPGRGPQSTMACYKYRDTEGRKQRPGWYFSAFTRIPYHEITLELLQKGLKPPELDAAILNRASRQISLVSHMEQLPHEKNAITINYDKKDSAGDPSIEFYFSYSDYERNGFEHIRRTFKQIGNHLGAEILDITGPSSHHHLMGTTKMGSDKKQSVVNKNCQTHDHPNLYIVGSSTFVTGGSADPTLTIAALSLRLADHISKSQ